MPKFNFIPTVAFNTKTFDSQCLTSIRNFMSHRVNLENVYSVLKRDFDLVHSSLDSCNIERVAAFFPIFRPIYLFAASA